VWRTGLESLRLLESAQRDLQPIPDYGLEVTMPADPTRGGLVALTGGTDVQPLDVVFPVLHGTYGEDGTVQGLLEMAGVPYVGAGVLASAAGMDKAVMKALFRDAGLPVCRMLVVRPGSESREGESIDGLSERIGRELGYPCFVKPANLGSSVGITKVNEPAGVAAALAEAAAFDPKVVVEEGIVARELECGVVGNDDPEASVVGELVPSREFYDYADKYVESGARTVIPAEIPAATADEVRAMAIAAFKAIDCTGLARVDFFLEAGTGRVLLNEINTLPGFTSASMFPRLWEASGVPLPALIDRLIALALERHAAQAARRTSFDVPPTPVSGARRSSGGSR
jgi:D-alanine-D-alanine ligase